MILIGQHACIEQAEEAIQNERRLSLALRSGGYAAWDHDYRTGQTYNSPEMYDLLGFDRDSRELTYNSFNDLVHPDAATRHSTTRSATRLSAPTCSRPATA